MGMIQVMMNKFGYTKKGMGTTAADTTFWKTIRQLKSLGDDGENVEDPYKKSVWVYSSINAIATNIGSVPFRLYTTKTKDKKSIVEEGQMYELFANPNPYYTESENVLKVATMTYLEVFGECFWVFEGRDNITQIPTEIYPMNPTRFTPMYVSTKEGKKFTGYWQYDAPDTTPDNAIIFAPHQILHIRYFNPYDDIRGLSPIEASRMGVNQDYFSSKFNENFFKEGAAIGGIIEVEDTLNQNEFETLRMQFEDRHKGYDKAHKVAVLTGGASFKEVKMSQRDMEFISLKTITRGEILAAFKTNEVVLGNYENIQCLSPDMEVMTIDGWKYSPDIIEGELLASLSPEGNIEFKPVTKVYKYDYKGKMYTQKKSIINGKERTLKTDYLVSPEHKMYGKEKDSKHGKFKSDFMFKRISDIKEASFASPRNGKWDGELIDNYIIEKKEYENGRGGTKEIIFPIVPWLKFLGWFVTEGCYRKDTFEVAISQKKEEGIKQIREDLKDFPYKVNEYNSDDHGITFIVNGKDLYNYLLDNVGGYCYEKRIPKDILKLHPSLLIHLYNAMIDGDGTRWRGGEDLFTSTSKQLAEDLFEIALRIGRVPVMYGGKEGKKRDEIRRNRWTVRVSNKKYSEKMVNIRPQAVDYDGTLHCFEVPPYHTIMSRYNGKTLIISNSYEGIRMAHQSFWRETLVPKMLYLEDVLWSKFFSKIDKGKIWGGFDLSGVQALQEDYNNKVAAAEILNKIGVPLNEISKRLDLGFPEFEWGKVWWVPASLIPATTAMQLPTPEEDPDPGYEPEDEPEPGPAEPESPTDDDDADVIEDEPVKDSALWDRYIWIQSKYENNFKSKLKKYFFEQRKNVLKNLNNENLLDKEKETTKLQNIFSKMYVECAKSGIQMIYDELGKDYTLKDIPNNINKEMINRNNLIAVKIVEGISNILLKVLEKSVENEDSIEEMAAKIKEIYNKFSGKINTIARCESAAIINMARYYTMISLGVKKHKWISRKEGGRILHKEYNQKDVDLGKSFDDSFVLLYPTYYKAPIEETINCLCFTIPII